MKSTFKKLTALTLVLALALSTGILASAATASSSKTTTDKSYGLTVQNNELLFTVGGKTTTTLPSKNSNVTVKSDSNKNMLVSYTDKSGKTKSASLGKQTTLTISGSAGSLTLDKSLGKTSAITLASGASATKLNVSAPCTVKINGKVGTLNVTAAATVTIASGASVEKKIVSSKTAKVTTLKKTSSTSSKNEVDEEEVLPKGKTLRMKVGTIELDEADYLENLEGELSDAVEVTIPKDDETMYGTFKWNSSGNVKVVDGKSYAFTFYPDDEEYEIKKGSIHVYIDRPHGDITLEYKNGNSTIEVKEGTRISSIKSKMRDYVTAYDDDNKISGSYDFDESSSNTVTDGRTYSFTFKPSSNRYDECDGSITIVTTK